MRIVIIILAPTVKEVLIVRATVAVVLVTITTTRTVTGRIIMPIQMDPPITAAPPVLPPTLLPLVNKLHSLHSQFPIDS